MLRARVPPKRKSSSEPLLREDLPTTNVRGTSGREGAHQSPQQEKEEEPLDVRILLAIAAFALLIGTGVGLYLAYHPIVDATLAYSPKHRPAPFGLTSFRDEL